MHAIFLCSSISKLFFKWIPMYACKSVENHFRTSNLHYFFYGHEITLLNIVKFDVLFVTGSNILVLGI